MSGVIERAYDWLGQYFPRFRITKRCPNCDVGWNGHYPKEYMDYCHHCGEELVEP